MKVNADSELVQLEIIPIKYWEEMNENNENLDIFSFLSKSVTHYIIYISVHDIVYFISASFIC